MSTAHIHVVILRVKNMSLIIRGLESCTQVTDTRWRQCDCNDMLEVFMASF